MSAEKKSRNEPSDAARKMGLKVELRRDSKQGQSRSSKFEDSREVPNPSGKPRANPQPNGLSRQRTGKKEDELVKYMSNLPGFLQQAEKQKNVQVKALNFGVLDWKLLEKYKPGEQMPARDQPKASSSGGSLSMETGKAAPSKTSTSRRRHSSTELHYRSSSGVRLPEGKAKSHEDPQTVSRSKIAEQQKDVSQSARSSSRSIHDKGKKKEPDHTQSISSKSSLGKSRTLNKKISDSSGDCNPQPQNIVLLKPKCHMRSSSLRLSPPYDGQLGSDGSIGRDRDSGLSSSQELQSGELSHEFPHSCPRPPSVATHEKVQNVRLSPQQSEKSMDNSSSEAKSSAITIDAAASADSSRGISLVSAKKIDSRGSSRRHLADVNRIRYSDPFSSQEFSFRELDSEFLHSCPLPSGGAVSQASGSDHSTYPFQIDASLEARLSNATCPESKSCNFADLVPTESFNEMEMAFGKNSAQKGRHPEPRRSFSFSLGRLSRSFSFKDTSSPTDNISTHSAGEVFGDIDECKTDKGNASARRRPSPFKKLLDPLLKAKLGHSFDAAQTKHNSSVSLQPTNMNKPLSSGSGANAASPFQALMQINVKNGVPFFKFVVDNRSDILAAALKQLPSADGKADCNLTYSFYSVHEIKKKAGGWITNGLKEKNRGFGYDVVGQMKLSRTFLLELNENGNLPCVVTESVLYDVSLTGGDKGLPDVSPNREIAAVIMKDSIAEYNNLESKAGNSTTVILPGALHSLPSSGTPSSLIQRWKTGGLCDCGGWDVGCKLKILEDHEQRSNFSLPRHLNLFVQGGSMKKHPIFSLVPVEAGLYSVEFHSSVSLLEGFSICVAAIVSREFGDIFDCKNLGESNLSAEANSGYKDKDEFKFQGELPARFASFPPSSPVGRI